MPEFLTLLPPDEARARLLSNLSGPGTGSESIATAAALGRIAFEDLRAPHALPQFPRSTVDGYAVRAADTFGAGESQPAYLTLIGEIPMGGEAAFELAQSQCGLIHTGGMLPRGADAVVMLEYTQRARTNEIEVFRAAAPSEGVIAVGEDVKAEDVILKRGHALRPADIGGLIALGLSSLRVATKPRVAIIGTGDEVVGADVQPRPGQVRDVNSYTLSALTEGAGAAPRSYGIIPDSIEQLTAIAAQALRENDVVVITAGSSASTRDVTAEVIGSIGSPGVLVHGINTRPGKPTILGVCAGKAVIGLPGNPVSALVNGYLFVVPVIEKLLGALPRPKPTVTARLTVNLPSQAGREDWWPIRLSQSPAAKPGERGQGGSSWLAEPVFGKSNLIFSLAAADGLLRIPPDATGISAGEIVDVLLI